MALHPYFCHLCRAYFRIGTNLHDPKCLYCDTRFVEEAESVDEPSETEEDDDDDDDDNHMEDQTAFYLTLRSAPRLAQDGHQGTQQARWVVHFADGDDDNSDNDNDTRIEEDKDEPLEDAFEAMSLDEQQWETEGEYGNVSSSISTSRPGSVIAASASSSSSLSFASSSSSPHQPTSALLSSPTSSSSSYSSSLYRPPSSSFSSPSSSSSSSSSSSLPRTSGSHQQQHRSLSSTNHRSSTRQDSFFRIERLLDIIYQGYSESENEHDDTHRSFMDNLMEIFSDPMETPQASNSDDLDQCIERLSRRTLLQDNSETKLECTICQESFGANAEILQMPCQHEYHTVCISQWLRVNATCPICRCPVIMERSDDLGPPPAFSLGSLTTRRHSYPSITDEDTQVFDDDDDDDDYHDGDDEDEVLSDYYEMIDPPPMWARSSSSATVTRYLCTYHHLS